MGDGERWQRKEVGCEIGLLPFDFGAHSTPHQGGGPNSDENYSELHVQAQVGVVCGQGQEVEVTGQVRAIPSRTRQLTLSLHRGFPLGTNRSESRLSRRNRLHKVPCPLLYLGCSSINWPGFLAHVYPHTASNSRIIGHDPGPLVT
jgi:hypothetical protein